MTRLETLEKVFELARRQRESLARGDLARLSGLQDERLALLQALPPGRNTGEEARLAAKIRGLDLETRCVLTMKKTLLQEKIQTLGTLKKMLKSPGAPVRREASRLSCRA